MLEDSAGLHRFGVNFYNFIQKHAPWFHHPFYWIVEAYGWLNRDRVHVGGAYYREVLKNFRPHLVFSVHDCLNRGFFQTAREVLGVENVRCATYCSEFSGGYGYSRNWVEPTVDLYLSRTRTAADYAIGLGLPPARLKVRGHLMPPCVYEERLDGPRRRQFREQLGLDPDKFTVFLATGGSGANNHLELLPVLASLSDHYQAVVVCGKNQRAYRQVLEWRRHHPRLRCSVEGYSRQMHLLIQASDVMVSRGGTTTCAKALHYGCPILLNGFRGVMPQERLTVKFFMQDGASVLISRSDDLRRVLERWIREKDAFAELKGRFLRLRYEEEPERVIRELVALAREAAHPLPRPSAQAARAAPLV
ncbi:MAG: glycosyltransferase [Puniceicoccaceae bacterium]|nr:MAG: glycosyltransferase [Puniceicoccaceae bacterium]